MAQMLFIYLHSIIIPLLSIASGLTMEMIPIDSPRLNLLPQHFSAQERHEYLVNISLSRAHNNNNNKFQGNNSMSSPNSFEAPLYGPHNKVSYYITPLYVGESYSTFALLDTGDCGTWIQCEGCYDCFEFQGKRFNYKNSPTYAKISFTDPLCTQPKIKYWGTCGFRKDYFSGQIIEGFVGKDNFYFKNSKTQNLNVYKDLVFGCAMKAEGGSLGGPSNLISGIHGVGMDERSFIKQLNNQIKGRFSYCLPSFDENKQGESIMYFGDDAQISGDDTRQVKVISMSSGCQYHAYLNGISVDGSRLPIDPSIFEVDQSRGEGFIIDSGAPYTTLDKRAYNVLVYYVAKYFGQKYDWQPIPLQNTNQVLCYKGRYPDDDSVFPSIIFHFQGKEQGEEVDMILDHKNMFLNKDKLNRFCMMVIASPHPRISLLGAYQQLNFKFLYDIPNNLLYFVPQRCQDD